MAKPISKSEVDAREPDAQPRVQLAQWRALRAVVDAGGYAQAAERLHRSQSAVTYAVQKLERVLGVAVFQLRGRKATLTPAGDVLYQRAGMLLEDAAALERAAGELAAGGEAELRLAVDAVFPTWLLLAALARFASTAPATRIELMETVLGGTEEALVARKVDLAITSIVPAGFMGDPLLRLRFVAVAAPSHPLHALGRPLTRRDLRRYRQLVIRDSATQHQQDAGWLGAEARWTVTNKATSIRAARMGLGFAWYPENVVREELASGTLKALPLREGRERYADLYLVIADPDFAGPGALRLAATLRAAVATHPASAKLIQQRRVNRHAERKVLRQPDAG
ncbi:MAG: LysR family transcriptional regulator [Rhodanobacter sp.]